MSQKASEDGATKGNSNLEDLRKALHQQLSYWNRCKGADEYDDLPLREPWKQQILDPVLNRFGGAMGPYADSFVNDVPGVDYINATEFSFDDPAEFKYLATMCPKVNTFEHFWMMVWHKQVKIIVNLTHFHDRIGSERTDKRERYWPEFSNCPENLDSWKLVLSTKRKQESTNIAGLSLYTVEIYHKSMQERRNVTIFWYSQWEDFTDSSTIYTKNFMVNARNALRLTNQVDALQNKHIRDKSVGKMPPLLVHCR